MAITTAADRRALAAYLTRNGTTHGNAIRAALEWEPPRFWDAVYGPADGWFAITLDGWSLTDAGRLLIVPA